MKKVLILAYDFPPYVSVGGLRPYSWYKYLNEFGVYPIVVTRQWNNEFNNHLDYIAPGDSTESIIETTAYGTIVKAPYTPNFANKLMLKYGNSKYALLRKCISAYFELAQFLYLTGPKAPLYFAAERYLKNNQVDVIIATGDPFILFNYAAKLSKKFNIPWIADYRDPWSQNLHIQQNYILKKWFSFFEKKTIRSASLITTVSDFLEAKISELIENKKFLILPNGYDPEAFENIELINQQSDSFNIAFVGSIYNWHPVKSFLSVISLFIKNNTGSSIKVNFYGINNMTELNEMIAIHFNDLSNHITFHPKTENKLLIQKLAKDNILLLFNNYSLSGTKIYDYIRLKRAILFCYANDEEAKKLKKIYFRISELKKTNDHLQEDIINETNSGYVIQDSKHLLSTLDHLHKEHSKTGLIQCNTINTEQYSRKHQVKQLAKLIHEFSLQKK